jgi:hypothetical protein
MKQTSLLGLKFVGTDPGQTPISTLFPLQIITGAAAATGILPEDALGKQVRNFPVGGGTAYMRDTGEFSCCEPTLEDAGACIKQSVDHLSLMFG